jgi:hypothetical protein
MTPKVMCQFSDQESEIITFEQSNGYLFDVGPDRVLDFSYSEVGDYIEPRTMMLETNDPGSYMITGGEISGIGLPHPDIQHSLNLTDLVYNTGTPQPPVVYNNPLGITGIQQDWIGINIVDPSLVYINSDDKISITGIGLEAGIYEWTVSFTLSQI